MNEDYPSQPPVRTLAHQNRLSGREPGPAEKPVSARPEGELGTILLVEDEETIRWPVAQLLQAGGYRVLEAASGGEAAAIWRQHHPNIDLLLTDLVMDDDMTGAKLAEQLRLDKPTLKVIFTSGYSPEMVSQVFELPGKIYFLQKPCAAQKLLETVHHLLTANFPKETDV